MDAATLTIDLDKRRCCYCSPSKNRCRSDSCLCFKQGRQCDVNCESSNWTSDCLNKPTVRCQCALNFVTKIGKTILCQQNPNCPCYKYNEACTGACACAGDCSNAKGQEYLLNYDQSKLERISCGCSCSSRGGCRKFKKCLCLQSLAHCGPGCKCKQGCGNSKARLEVSKHTRNYFFDPEECPSGATAILRIDAASCSFQMEFVTPNLEAIHAEELISRVLTRALSIYSIPIQHIIVYTPNSPCFHQDCRPRCEIVDSCVNPRSCADTLSVLYKQVQKLTRNTQMEMTVRFLNPYVARGDLYTKRAILAMMEVGIRVELITIKDWTELMRDSYHKVRKRSISSDRIFQKRQHANEIAQPSSSYYQLWNVADMDRFVRLSQHYINECRGALGYEKCYWTSAFHDLLKMTISACANAGEKFNHIGIHLNPPLSSSRTISVDSTARDKRQHQMKRQCGLNIEEDKEDGAKPNCSTPGASSISAHSSFRKTPQPHRIRYHSGPVTYDRSDMVVQASRSITEININEEYVVGPPSPNLATFTDSQLDEAADQRPSSAAGYSVITDSHRITNHTFSSMAPSMISLQAPSAAVADKILLNLSGRNITEAEQKEIKAELAHAIGSIQQQITALMQYLDQKIASVPV